MKNNKKNLKNETLKQPPTLLPDGAALKEKNLTFKQKIAATRKEYGYICLAALIPAVVFFLAGDEYDVTLQKRGVAAAHVIVEGRVFGEETAEEDREGQRDQDERDKNKDALYLDL